MIAIISDFDGPLNEENVFASRNLLGDWPDGIDGDDCREGGQCYKRLVEHASDLFLEFAR